ncbi:hypothetical protein CPB85DRAFT_1262392 [Mucidula mucida]|nr:hypothetical protein CPB85DRAFT_1262392 [Mucidula mucida]
MIQYGYEGAQRRKPDYTCRGEVDCKGGAEAQVYWARPNSQRQMVIVLKLVSVVVPRLKVLAIAESCSVSDKNSDDELKGAFLNHTLMMVVRKQEERREAKLELMSIT